MASIRRHRDKFQVRIRRHGFPTLTKTFSTHADAKEWATLQERQADRGELGPDRKALEGITLASLVERYRDTVLPGKKGGAGETIMLNAFLRHSICKKTLANLSVTDFAAWRDDKLKGRGGRKVTAKSVKRFLSPIQHMFSLAMDEWGIPLRHNPLARFRLKTVDNKRQRRLKEGEWDRLREAGRKTQNPLVMLIVRLALETTMRRGELLALRWRDIDLERASLTIPESKNGHSRTIPLSIDAIGVLREAGRLAGEMEGKALVFPMKPNALLLSWTRLIRRAQIEDLHFHDLRHEAISRLFELGLTVPEVASISGHRTLSQLMRYAHATDASIRRKLAGPDDTKPTDPAKSPTPRETANDNREPMAARTKK